MLPIALLILLAIAGILYGAYLVRREKESRVAALILELEEQAELEPGSGTPPETEGEGGLLRSLSGRIRRFLPAALMESYEERLRWTGRPFGMDAEQFVSLKLVCAALLPALIPVLTLFHLGSGAVMLMLCAGIAGLVLPDIWLNGRLAERKRTVQEELPLFTDLIATSISAGLSLTEAVRRVAADAPGLVAREFLRAVQEMAAGKQRMHAWRDLMERVPGEEFRSIVSAIMQAEQYGTSVSEILRYQVKQIRTFKQQEAQRIAQATTVKMRIPMLLLILLPFMVLLLGPALLQIGHLLL